MAPLYSNGRAAIEPLRSLGSLRYGLSVSVTSPGHRLQFVTVTLPAGTMIQRRYRLERLLGTGGLGSTYRALDLAEEEAVALKLLHAGEDATGHAILGAEFRMLRGLSHPSLARVRDLGQA